MARILYFATLVSDLSLGSEDIDLSGEVTDVSKLLALLRSRGGVWEQRLADNAVRVTVNKQFADLNATIGNNDEIAIIPMRF
jgi:molybdopterin converting factor small subunit